VPTPGFSTVFERSGRGLSGEIVGIIVRCGPSALQLQARSAPRGWHHCGPNIPDGHQNGLMWGPLVPWNPVNALQSWRRLCDPNGSVRVVGCEVAFASRADRAQVGAAVTMRAHRPHSSTRWAPTRCVVFFVTDAREIVLVARAPSLRRAGAHQIRGAPASASPAARL
jgi:hypothetical protein